MNELQLFNFEGKEVKTIQLNNEIYFVGKDVCTILELADVSKAISRLDEDEKLIRTLFLSGQNREVLLINESGLYSLVLTSRKPEAKKFKRWVTSEVLPSIRKTGSYGIVDPRDARIDKLLDRMSVVDKLIDAVNQNTSNLTAMLNNMSIKHEPVVETAKYFQPSNSNQTDDKSKYHRIVNYAKKFRPDIDNALVRERAREIGVTASRMSKEQKIKILEEPNLDNRYPGMIKFYHENILKDAFRTHF